MASSTTSQSRRLPDVRGRFPALAGDAGFFDGPGGSQVPQEVLDAMATYLRDSNANLGGAFATSVASDEVMGRGRAAAADLTGAEPEGIAFGANMTTLNFLLAHAVARTLRPGDEIVVTQLDHDANVSPWLLIAADHELVVRHAPIRRDDVTLDHDYLRSLGDGSLDLAFERIAAHEDVLSRRFLDGVPDRVELYGIREVEGRTPTFCFNLPGHSPRAVAERLAERGLYVWDGDYYALDPMRALGLADRGGAVRAGFLHYTTATEVDRLLDALAA